MIYNSMMRLGVCVIAALFALNCASSSAGGSDSDASAQTKASAERAAPEGPFDVVLKWAEQPQVSGEASEEAVELIEEWERVEVARVWSRGEDYLAVVVDRNSTRETPAILLTLEMNDEGGWRVARLEATTSTHLWPEL